ncbi:MAG: FtsQ-type POTRA domain-containing protein [Pseudomonadota bacterium]
MSTLTMNNQGRLGLGGKRGNSLHRRKPHTSRSLSHGGFSGSFFAGAGRMVVRLVMTMLVLSLVAVLGVGLLYGYRVLTSHPYFSLDEIHVTGNTRVSRGDILKTAEIGLGLNSFEMKVDLVEQKISDNPWVLSATVRREFPNRLRIAVVEKVPAFWLRQGDSMYFADAAGRIIAPMHPGEFASLPVLSVAEGIDDGGPVLAELVKKMAQRQTPFTQAQVAWIRLTSAHDMEVHLDGQGGQGLTLRLSMDRWEIQLDRLKVVWRDLMRRGEFADAAIIAASGDKVWIKKRPAGGA